MYGKIVNNTLLPAPSYIIKNGMVYYNPSAALYEECGWKEVVTASCPQDDTYYISSWEEQDEKIVQVWNPGAEEEKASDPTLEDRIKILEEKIAIVDILLGVDEA